MFLDSDDYLALDACEKLYDKAEKEKLDIVMNDFIKIFDDGRKEYIKQPNFKNSSLKNNPNIISENLSPWAKLYSTKLIKENNIKFVEDLKYEDAPFVIEALDKANNIGKINEALNYYVIHGNSETTVLDKRVFDILKIVDIIRKYSQGKEYLKEKIDELTVRIITNYTIQQRNQKEKETAIKFIDKAFDYLKKEIPDYKNNKYYKNRGIIKRTIEKNKLLTKIYCELYRK